MSTSLLYHGFGIRGYRYEKTEYEKGAVTFVISQPRESSRCSQCGSDDVIGRGGNDRRFRTLPIGGKPVYLAFWVPRVECRGCGAVRRVKVGFADQRVSYTRAFERYALELSRYMTIKDVACHLQISWDVIKEIQKRNLRRRFGKPKLKHLKQIAIDEISTGSRIGIWKLTDIGSDLLRMALLTGFCAEHQLTRCIVFRRNASVGRLVLV